MSGLPGESGNSLASGDLGSDIGGTCANALDLSDNRRVVTFTGEDGGPELTVFVAVLVEVTDFCLDRAFLVRDLAPVVVCADNDVW